MIEVAPSFTGYKGLQDRQPIFIAVEGATELIQNKEDLTNIWNKD
jgi:hypothetical protein